MNRTKKVIAKNQGIGILMIQAAKAKRAKEIIKEMETDRKKMKYKKIAILTTIAIALAYGIAFTLGLV